MSIRKEIKEKLIFIFFIFSLFYIFQSKKRIFFIKQQKLIIKIKIIQNFYIIKKKYCKISKNLYKRFLKILS